MLKLTHWALPLLAAVCFVRLWLMPLGSSFWVDEMATIFVVEHGAEDPSLQVAPQVAQSIYYPVVRAVRAGRSEIAYRIPSIVFMGLALLFVALLTARLVHRHAWWFAIFACFALKGVNYEAGNARPYAMGMCIAAAGLYFLVRWFDTQDWWEAAAFVILAALLWRVHLIFWPFYGVFAIYAMVRCWKSGLWLRTAGMFGLVAILLIPVALRALALNAQASEHVVVAQPKWMDLAHSLRFVLVAGAGLGAWVWSRLAKGRDRVAIPASAVALIVAWWALHPLALFAFSRLTGNSVFVPRYLALALPGTAVAATLAAALFLPSRFWKPAALLMGLAALISANDWHEVWTLHHNSDWRAAAAAVNQLALPASTPVICPSPFIEARPPAWTPAYKLPGFLYAHLPVYPVRGELLLFPFLSSRQADAYAVSLVQGSLASSGRFVVYGPNGGAHFWRDWFARRPELAGWKNRSLGDFRDVDAIVFEK